MADSSYLQELERRSNDLLRIYNPLDEDYIVEWDRTNGTKVFRVPAKGEAVFIRYIAEKYMREMYQRIVNNKVIKKIKEANENRLSKGMSAMDTWKEQLAFEMPLLSQTQEQMAEILSILFVKVENEYGVDEVVEQKKTKPDRSFGEIMKDIQENATSTTNQRGRDIPSTLPESQIGHTKVQVMPEKDSLSCDQCDFVAKVPIALLGHKRSHQAKKAQAIKGVSQ